MLALVADYRLNVVVARAGEALARLEALGFADRALPGFFGGLDLVVPHTSYVLGDEVGPGRFGNG